MHAVVYAALLSGIRCSFTCHSFLWWCVLPCSVFWGAIWMKWWSVVLFDVLCEWRCIWFVCLPILSLCDSVWCCCLLMLLYLLLLCVGCEDVRWRQWRWRSVHIHCCDSLLCKNIYYRSAKWAHSIFIRRIVNITSFSQNTVSNVLFNFAMIVFFLLIVQCSVMLCYALLCCVVCAVCIIL